MKLLQPDLHIDRLADIDLDAWHEKGIRCILVDLDNTISPWREGSITEEARDFFARARAVGMTAILFSNAKEAKAREAAWSIGIAYYASAGKPFSWTYRKALLELSYCKEETMAIGDQVFTDVLGGNIMGLTTVLIPPISAAEFFGTKVLRFLERVLAGRKTPYPS